MINALTQLLEALRTKNFSEEFVALVMSGRDDEYATASELVQIIDELERLPDLLRPLVRKVLEPLPGLQSFSVQDVTDALSTTFAGQELSLPEHFKSGILRAVALLVSKGAEPWDCGYIDLDGDGGPTRFLEWYYKASHADYADDLELQSSVQPLTAEHRDTCCVGTCAVSMTPEIVNEHERGWEDLQAELRWHHDLDDDAAFLARVRDFGEAKQWEKPYWEGAWGAALYLVPWFFRSGEKITADCRLILDGFYTQAAKRSAMQTLHSHAPHLLETILEAATVAERPRTEEKPPRQIMIELKPFLRDFGESELSRSSDDRVEEAIGILGIPGCLYAYEESTLCWFSQCLNLCLEPKEKLTGLDDAIFRSLRLVRAARETEEAGLSVGFSLGAVEAILTWGSRGEDVMAKLCRRCLTLLQPDGAVRKQDSEHEKIKKLYDRRSAVFHGRSLDGTEEEQRAALRIASGVLRAVCAYQRLYRSRGDNLGVKKLKRDLQNHYQAGTSLEGLPDLSDLLPATS